VTCIQVYDRTQDTNTGTIRTTVFEDVPAGSYTITGEDSCGTGQQNNVAHSGSGDVPVFLIW